MSVLEKLDRDTHTPVNNPFSRLKHYKTEEIDPLENHATECLAACLVFSEAVRNDFIRFLLPPDDPFANHITVPIEIETQYETDGFGCLDLLFKMEGSLQIVVEVKVNAKEDARHVDQLQRYSSWLDKQPGEHRLFTLVKNPDAQFFIKRYGVTDRKTWQDLYNRLLKLKQTPLHLTDLSLIVNLCDYLESEGIVANYEPKDLFDYKKGMRANKALIGIFNQIIAKLKAKGFDAYYSTKPFKEDFWQALEIENPKWRSIFGPGSNRKIVLWFMIPGIWDATRHEFCLDIVLWHKEHQNEWKIFQSNLSNWLRALADKQMLLRASRDNWKREEEISPDSTFVSEPLKIHACEQSEPAFLDQDHPQDEQLLIAQLVEKVEQFDAIISSLPRK